jgi:hypothetical protein
MEATLEAEVEKPSRFSQVVDQFKQWRQLENRAYLDHYLINCAKIIFGYRPIDYSSISHENAVVHSWIRGIDDLPANKVSPDNKVVGSRLLNLETGKYE